MGAYAKIGNLLLNSTSPIGNQWVVLSIMDLVLESVCMESCPWAV